MTLDATSTQDSAQDGAQNSAQIAPASIDNLGSKISCKLSPHKTMLVLGATSEIAQATLPLLIQDGWGLILAGRNMAGLTKLQTELMHFAQSNKLPYAISCAHFDTTLSCQEQQEFWVKLSAASKIDGVFCAIGYLGQPHQAEHDLSEGLKILNVNFGGLIPILSLVANYFEEQQGGKLIVISSVAGERGRAANYAYGSAKAAMNAYLSGLRARLSKSHVQVLTVLPGLVKTRMIAHRAHPRPCATPQEVACDIMRGIRHNQDVVYSRWYWRIIMCVVKHLPEAIFKRMRNI